MSAAAAALVVAIVALAIVSLGGGINRPLATTHVAMTAAAGQPG